MNKFITFFGLFSLAIAGSQHLDAAITLSGTAASNLLIHGSSSTVPVGSEFLLVADPSGLGNFSALETTNSIPANSLLTVGSTLDGFKVIYSGGAVSNSSGFPPSSGNATFSAQSVDVSSYLNDPFALVWFDSVTSTATTAPAGAFYGVVTDQSSATKWVLPSSNSTSLSFAVTSPPGYSEQASPGSALYQIQSVPEPSLSILAAFGVFGVLIRRRRHS